METRFGRISEGKETQTADWNEALPGLPAIPKELDLIPTWLLKIGLFASQTCKAQCEHHGFSSLQVFVPKKVFAWVLLPLLYKLGLGVIGSTHAGGVGTWRIGEVSSLHAPFGLRRYLGTVDTTPLWLICQAGFGLKRKFVDGFQIFSYEIHEGVFELNAEFTPMALFSVILLDGYFHANRKVRRKILRAIKEVAGWGSDLHWDWAYTLAVTDRSTVENVRFAIMLKEVANYLDTQVQELKDSKAETQSPLVGRARKALEALVPHLRQTPESLEETVSLLPLETLKSSDGEKTATESVNTPADQGGDLVG